MTLLPSDDVERGTGQLLLNLTTSEGQTTTFEEVVSVEISEGSTGLFNILPPAASGAIVAALVIGGVVLARRMKKSVNSRTTARPSSLQTPMPIQTC